MCDSTAPPPVSAATRLLLGLAIVALVFAAFFPVLTHNYGWNDDYQILKRVAERSYKWRTNEAMESGRPLAGWAVGVIFRVPQSIDDLKRMRIVSVAATAVFALCVYGVLLVSGFEVILAFAASLLMVLTPAFGIYAGWLTTGPDPFAAAAALVGGALVVGGLEFRPLWQKSVSFLLAFILIFGSCCFYQPIAAFAELAVFIRLLSPAKPESRALKNFFIATFIVGAMLATYFVAFKICTRVYGWQGEAGRAAISANLFNNLHFVFTRLLWSALAGWAQFHARAIEVTAASLTVGVVAFGGLLRPGLRRWQIALGIVVTFLFSVLPQLFLAEQLFAFRTQAVLLALAGLMLAYGLDGCLRLARRWPSPRAIRLSALAGIAVVMTLVTHREVWRNFVQPCVREQDALTGALKKLKTFPEKLAFAPPGLWRCDLPDLGEYRAVSSSCCWVSPPMLDLLLIQLYDPDVSLKKAIRRHPLFEVQCRTVKNQELPFVDGINLISGECSATFNDPYWGAIQTNRTGWTISPWFGVFNTRDFPRVYHSQLGWIHCQPRVSDGYEFISEEFGTFRTSAVSYPDLYFTKADRQVQLLPTIQWPPCIFRDLANGQTRFSP